jgi:hypothetical protein
LLDPEVCLDPSLGVTFEDVLIMYAYLGLELSIADTGQAWAPVEEPVKGPLVQLSESSEDRHGRNGSLALVVRDGGMRDIQAARQPFGGFSSGNAECPSGLLQLFTQTAHFPEP